MAWAADRRERECSLLYRGLVEDLSKKIQEAQNLIVKWNRQGVGGWFQVITYTHKIDQILRELFKAIFQGSYPDYSIVALGGYGRRELNLQSDVDLMFLYTRDHPERDERVFAGIQCLWDLGLQIGHCYRSVEEATAMALEDMTVKTSYIDSRLLGGSLNPFVSFSRAVEREVVSPNREAFLEELYHWTVERHAKFGSTMYLLEPNVKESPGNLRDIHTVMWVAKTFYKVASFKDLKRRGLLTPLEYETLERALDFIWRVRNDVHSMRKRKNDVLSLDIQPEVALHMGFRDTRKLLAVEHFMRDYYSRVRDIRRISRAFILRTMEEVGLRPQISPSTDIELIRDVLERTFPTPALFLQEVHGLQEKGVDLSDIPRGFWVPPLHWRVENFNSPEVREALTQIFSSPKPHQVLRFLHEIGFLERLFPPWERLTGLMQYDLYHRYTVDEHTLMAIQYAEELEEDPNPQHAYLREAFLRHRDKKHLLIMAILFHDIGKGLGGGHALRGARMATNILEEMGFSEEIVDTVQFLVRHHTTMTQMALRRDSTDPRVAMEMADICKDTERLDLLYILTYADLRAVGPDVWTEWKGALVLDLYLKTQEILEKGVTLAPEMDEETFHMIAQELHRHLKGLLSIEEIEEELRQFPDRYLLQVPAEKMANHLLLVKKARRDGIAITHHHNHDAGYTEVSIAKKEQMGDFSKVVGIISSHRLNILSAWVFPRNDNYFLDIIHVNDLHFRPVTDERVWQKIEKEMNLVFKGEMDLDELIKARKGTYVSKREKVVGVKTKITLDNNISDLYSVIEIKAQDKLGLLYLITRTFYVLGVTIHMARISTEGNRAVDAFYVTKKDGSKFSEREFITISRLLKEAIEQEQVPIESSAQLAMHFSESSHAQGP